MDLGGRPRAINSPEDFERLAFEYIEWVKNNPVNKTITAAFQGVISHKQVPHMRGMTQFGLASYMKIGLSTLKDYGQREEYSAIYGEIDAIMKAWNLDGAVSGDLNPTLVARIDGHSEKQDIEHKVSVANMSDEDLDARIKALQNDQS